MAGLRRRELLMRGGSFAGALALTTLGPAATGVQRALAAATGLSDSRRRTYVAAVDALATDGVAAVGGGRGTSAADAFGAIYDSQRAAWRAWVDDVLDGIESGPGSTRFSDLSAAKRAEFLRRWVYNGNPRPVDPPTARSRSRADSGSPALEPVIRHNVESYAGTLDPRTGIRVVPLAGPFERDDGGVSEESVHRCTQASALAAWVLIPFLPEPRPAADYSVVV